MKRFLALVVALAACASEDGPEVLRDQWQVVRLLGQDSGWGRRRSVRRGEIIETTVEMSIVMKRAGVDLAAYGSETTEERASDGTLVRLRATKKLSEYETEIAIRFEGTKAFLTTTVAGQSRESTKECGAGLVGPYRLEQRIRDTGLKPGTTFTVGTFQTDLGGPVVFTITIGAEEEVELLDGRKERLTRVETTMKQLPVKPISWLDAEGRERKLLINVAGVPMEVLAATEERAKRPSAPSAPAAPPDVFEKSLLAPKHPIPYPRKLDRATFLIRSKEMPDFADNRQIVEKREGDTVQLRIERKVPPENRESRKPPADLAGCLAANSMVQSDAPEIVAIARDAARGEADAWKVAQTLERWVHDNITEKRMDVGFASALEVARNREGDCTEHAVLLCALCRAAGIPSRVAMGVVCIGHAFGGHAWTEVWIDGAWYALDGTFGQGSVDATHLTLSRMAFEDSDGAEGFVGLLLGMGNLEIEPVEVVFEGRTLRPGDSDHASIDGRRYENRLFRLAFTCPEGFVFDAPRDRATMTTRLMELDGKTASGKLCEIEVELTDAIAWDTVKKALGEAEETTVDGRRAYRVTHKNSRLVCVLANDCLFLFELDRVEGGAELKAFDEFLASVDFDVK